MAALQKYEAEVKAIEKTQTPRKASVDSRMVKRVAASLKVLAQAGLDADKALAEIAGNSKLNAETVDAIRKEADI